MTETIDPISLTRLVRLAAGWIPSPDHGGAGARICLKGVQHEVAVWSAGGRPGEPQIGGPT